MPEAPVSWITRRPERPTPIRFRTVHLLYAVTLLATSLGTFGDVGLLVGVYFVAIWAVVFFTQFCSDALLLAFLLTVVFPCLLPAKSSAGPDARRMSCMSNLKQIALALHNYKDTYGSLPPACITDDHGRPLHSWRVLILPYIEASDLYAAYDFNEPWDSLNNRKLLDQRPSVFSCPSNTTDTTGATTFTHYLAVVGSNTAWPGTVGRKLSEITDGTSNTVLIVEAMGEGIPWTKPQDLTFDESVPILTSITRGQPDVHWQEGFFAARFVGRHVALVDGMVRLIPGGVSDDVWRSLLTIDDGSDLAANVLKPSVAPARKTKTANYIRFSVWIIVLLFPLPWAYKKWKRRAR